MTNIGSNNDKNRFDAKLSSAANVRTPLTSSMPAKPRVLPLKKRPLQLPHKKLNAKRHKLQHQGSSCLEPKHRMYKKSDHLQRVKFTLFLKILMHFLSMKGQNFDERARAVALDCIKCQREGKLQDTPLMSALKGRLFGIVGKKDWEICKRYLQRYLVYHNMETEL